MKKIIILCACILFVGLCSCNTVVLTTYYDVEKQQKYMETEGYFKKVYYPKAYLKNDPNPSFRINFLLDGKARTWSPDGILLQECFYDKKFLKKKIVFWENGEKKTETFYRYKGKYSHEYEKNYFITKKMFYDKDGRLILTSLFHDGIGKDFEFSDSGELSEVKNDENDEDDE